MWKKKTGNRLNVLCKFDIKCYMRHSLLHFECSHPMIVFTFAVPFDKVWGVQKWLVNFLEVTMSQVLSVNENKFRGSTDMKTRLSKYIIMDVPLEYNGPLATFSIKAAAYTVCNFTKCCLIFSKVSVIVHNKVVTVTIKVSAAVYTTVH